MAEHVQTRTLQLAGISQHPEPTPEQLAEAEAEAERVHKELAGQGFTPSGPAFRFDIRDKPLTEQVGQLKAFEEWASQASARRLAQQYNVTDSKELQAILADHRTYKPKSPISKSLQERFAAHLATQSDNERTRSVALSKIKAFSDWLTAEGKPLDFDSVAEYLDVVGSNAQTRKGHLWALRKIWRWAIKYDAPFRDQFRSAADPFTGHEHARVGATAGGSWAAYTREEAEQLHRAAANKSPLPATQAAASKSLAVSAPTAPCLRMVCLLASWLTTQRQQRASGRYRLRTGSFLYTGHGLNWQSRTMATCSRVTTKQNQASG